MDKPLISAARELWRVRQQRFVVLGFESHDEPSCQISRG